MFLLERGTRGATWPIVASIFAKKMGCEKAVTAYLAAGDESVTRVSLIQELVWALVSSVEFRFIR